jgi:PAS domain S-box-containing protein
MLGDAIPEVLTGQPRIWTDLGALPDDDGEPTIWFNLRWTPLRDEAGQVAGIYCDYMDATDKVRADKALRESRDRQKFLLQLNDVLRPLLNPRDIQDAATRLIGDYLQVDSVGYASLGAPGTQSSSSWTEDACFDSTHEFVALVPLDDFPQEAMDRLRTGEVVCLQDGVCCEAMLDGALVIGTTLVIPLRREDRTIGAFYIHQQQPRRWSLHEIRLVERVAGRIWSTIQWAATELALRESERRHQFLLTLTDTFRRLTDASAIERAGCEMLAGHLGLDCACYGASLAGTFRIRQAWTSAAGHCREAEVAALLERLLQRLFHEDDVVVLEDVAEDARLLPEEKRALADAQIAAFFGFMLVENDRRIAGLCGFAHRVRHWTRQELDLGRQAAGRIWSAAERATALEELSLREAELAQVQTAGGVGGVIIDVTNGLTAERSPEYRKLHGLGPNVRFERHEDWLARVHPDDRAQAERRLLDAIQHGDQYVAEYRIIRPDNGEVRWISARAQVQRDAHGRPIRLVGIHSDSTERHAMEEALRLSESRLRTLISGVPQLIWRAVGEGQWTWASRQWTSFTGQTSEESLGSGWLDPVHPDDRDAVREQWRMAGLRGEFSVECRIMDKAERRYRWFRTRAAPMRHHDGSITEWLGTCTDVDDLRSLQQRQQVLLAELQHRTRNLMSVIGALARRTAANSDDLPAFIGAFEERLAALSRANRLLSRLEEGRRIAFDVLLKEELRALGAFDERDGVTLDGPPGVLLRSSTVQVLALALHELGTNAIKYGALVHPHARLRVSWSLHEETKEGAMLRVEWQESGVPTIEPERRGYGRELIERALPYQLDASTSFEYGSDGVRCTICVPVARHSPAASALASQRMS